MPGTNIREVLKRHTDELMEIPGVVGIAEGELHGKPCIIVFVVDRNSALLKQIPDTIEGYPTHVEESGKFRAFGA